MIKISILIVLLPHLVYTKLRGTYECGITSYYTDSTNSLIANGEYALPGQWPWVVALNYDTYGPGFECTGTILTNRHILTERNCLQIDAIGTAKNYTNHENPNYVSPNILKVAFGQFKLLRFKRGIRVVGTVNRKVASYKIIPDFAHTTRDSGLAILILETPVTFSPFIRPICLRSGSTDLENVVDRTGYVVGWAFNESNYNDILVSEPRMLRIPIVNQETCLRNDQSFGSITSNRTFCAGLLGESGPCNGDLGSGLVLFNNSTGRYHLRGVMSEFLYYNLVPTCIGSKYSVYVDVAQYLSWIEEQISTT